MRVNGERETLGTNEGKRRTGNGKRETRGTNEDYQECPFVAMSPEMATKRRVWRTNEKYLATEGLEKTRRGLALCRERKRLPFHANTTLFFETPLCFNFF